MDEEKVKNVGLDTQNNTPETENQTNNGIMDELKRTNHSGFKFKFSKSKGMKALKRAVRPFIIFTTIMVLAIYTVLGPLFDVFDYIKDLTLNNMGLTLPNADSSAQSTLGKIIQGVQKLAKKVMSFFTGEPVTDDEADYWIDLSAESKFVVDKETGVNLAYIDEEADNQRLLLGRPALVKAIQESDIVEKDTKLIDITQNQLAELTEYYLENIQEHEYEEKTYTYLDNCLKELGIEGVPLRGLNLLGEAEYDDVNKILEDKETKELVEKYIAEFLRADIITQQPHKTNGVELVDPENEYHVDGGIFLYRTKEERVIPGSVINELEDNGGTKEVELVDEDYTRMKYETPGEFLHKALEEAGIYSSAEEAEEDIRDRGFKKIIEELPEQYTSGDGFEVSLGKLNELKYLFTQDPDTDNIVMVQYKKDQNATTNFETPLKKIGSSIEEVRNSSGQCYIKVVSMPYKDKIAKYIMPYEFLIELLEVTENPEFVYHVALLARNTFIRLVVQDVEALEVTSTDKYYYVQVPDGPPVLDEETGQYIQYYRTEKRKDKRYLSPLISDYTPMMQLDYADTWSWHEEFVYRKTTNVTAITTQNGPLIYTKEITANVQYSEPITKNTTHKSKQFLGLLRNTEGKCSEKDCFLKNNWQKSEPLAIKCVEKAEYDEDGKNVGYLLPGTNKRALALNTLQSGQKELEAMMQGNYVGYREWEKLIEDPKEALTEIQKYLEQGDKELKEDKYDDGKQDYRNAYIVKMQSVLEHFRYLMTYPENEGFYTLKYPTPLSVYGGSSSSIYCYPVSGTTGGSSGGSSSSYSGGVSEVGDLIWQNQITREEFIAIVENFVPPNGSGEYTSFANGYDTWFRPYAAQFFDISVRYGLNPMFIFANGIQESAYGSSLITYQKSNTFGIGAFDWDPGGSAYSFGGQVAGIEECNRLIKQDYITPGGQFYNQVVATGYPATSIDAVCLVYATDTSKAEQVKGYMQSIFGASGSSATGMGAPSSSTTNRTSGMGAPSGSTYAETGQTATDDSEITQSSSASLGNEATASWALAQVGKYEYYNQGCGRTAYSSLNGMGYCAEFAQSAIWEGTGYYMGGNAVDMPVENYFSSGGGQVSYISEEDMAKIPIGAYVRSATSSIYQHVSIYVGNGYVVEAGGDVIRKNKLNENDYGVGTYLGWTLVTGSNGQTSGSIGSGTSAATQTTKTYKCVNYNTGETWYTDFPSSTGSSSSGGASGGTSSGISIVSGDIAWKIWCALKDAGYDDIRAASALGNLYYESEGLNPTCENEIGAYGLAQWYNDRRWALQAFAAQRGKDESDADTQIQYLIYEITGPEQGQVRLGGYGYSDWVNAGSLDEATLGFMYWFEAPGFNTGSEGDRQALARQFYDQYHGMSSSSTPTGGSSGGAASGSAYANASASEKQKYVFPNGVPTTDAQMQQYLTVVQVPVVGGTASVQVHRAIAQDVITACQAAKNAGYEIYDIGGYRGFSDYDAGLGMVPGTDFTYSQHCYGLAVDINPDHNAMMDNGVSADPSWVYNPGSDKYAITSNSALVNTFRSLGWGWGGDWTGSRQDYMHFSYFGW